MEALWQVWEVIKPYVGYLGLVATWGGIAYVAIRNRREFSLKRFDRVNVSVNYVLGDKLAMRTLLETTPKEVWLNEYGVSLVVAAAARTTAEQPFVLLSDEKDMGYVKRAVKNVLSEHFAEAFLAQSLGVPIRTGRFVYAITYEKYESIRELKFRVVVAEDRALQDLFGPGAPDHAVSNQRHLDRLRVLRKMAELAAGDGKVNGVHVLDYVELGVIGG
jgi:hypothetical protein